MDDRQQTIRERAHAIWEREGRPDGCEGEHWERAERDLRSEEEGRGGRDDSAATSARPVQAPVSGAGPASDPSPGETAPRRTPRAGKGSVGSGGGSTTGRPAGSPRKARG